MTDFHYILEDLYKLDPSLREHESKLIPLLRALHAEKPDALPDEAFVAELRRTLQSHATGSENSAPDSSLFSSFFMLNKFSYAIAGAVLGVVVAAPVTYMALNQTPAPIADGDVSSFLSYSVDKTGSQAFGQLSNAGADVYERDEGTTAPAMEQGANAVTTEDSAKIAVNPRPQSGGGGPTTDRMMLPNPYIVNEYVYKGDPIELRDQTVDVLRRRRPNGGGAAAGVGSDLGLISLSSFPGSKLESVNMFQDQNNGYMISVNMREGNVWISQNWEKWNHPESTCQDEACFNKYRLKMSDVPADDVLVAAANAFLADHGVSLDHYGKPQIDTSWKDYAASPEGIYVPESITVTFPFLVNDKPVYEEGGNTLFGIGVGVDLRTKKVSGVWNLMTQNYDSSAYPAVTSQDEVQKYIAEFEKMDMSYLPKDIEVKTQTIELGTPVRGSMRMATAQGDLLVPALLFPVTKQPQDVILYRKFVTIPLAKELFDEMKSRGGMGPVMPLIME